MTVRAIALFFVLSIASLAPGTNLVVNSDFETYSTVPASFSNLADATGWSAPSLGSPDFFHSAAGNNLYGTPTNGFGSETALSGGGYANIRVYGNLQEDDPSEDYREYLQGTLSTPLVANKKYDVSFNVSRVELSSNYATANLGVFFTNTPLSAAHDKVLSVAPQVQNSGGILTTSSGWVEVKGSFTATGGEEYLVIGNFQTDAASTASFVGGGCCPVAMYYVDNVSVEIVPEPSVLALWGLGSALLMAGWSRFRKRVVPRI
jgi:hypothetical protein